MIFSNSGSHWRYNSSSSSSTLFNSIKIATLPALYAAIVTSFVIGCLLVVLVGLLFRRTDSRSTFHFLLFFLTLSFSRISVSFLTSFFPWASFFFLIQINIGNEFWVRGKVTWKFKIGAISSVGKSETDCLELTVKKEKIGRTERENGRAAGSDFEIL